MGDIVRMFVHERRRRRLISVAQIGELSAFKNGTVTGKVEALPCGHQVFLICTNRWGEHRCPRITAEELLHDTHYALLASYGAHEVCFAPLAHRNFVLGWCHRHFPTILGGIVVPHHAWPQSLRIHHLLEHFALEFC